MPNALDATNRQTIHGLSRRAGVKSEARHAPGTRTPELHAPTPDEIASLARPETFNPIKILVWMLALGLLCLVVISVFSERAGIPPEPLSEHPPPINLLKRTRP